MKRCPLFFLFAILLFSCNKKKVVVNGNTIKQTGKQIDSFYTADIENPQVRNILIELNTGVQGANCPAAFDVLKTIQSKYPDRVKIAAMHGDKNLFNEPMTGLSKYDFRNNEAWQIVYFKGAAVYPTATLSNEGYSNQSYFDSKVSGWMNRVDTMISKNAPVNIHLQSSYTESDNTCELIAKIACTQDIVEQLFLAVYVVENGIRDYQQIGLIKQADYEHNFVLRDCVTGVFGDEMDFKGRKAGTVFQKRISINPTITGDNAWNLNNCKIIVSVARKIPADGDNTVLNCQEISIK